MRCVSLAFHHLPDGKEETFWYIIYLGIQKYSNEKAMLYMFSNQVYIQILMISEWARPTTSGGQSKSCDQEVVVQSTFSLLVSLYNATLFAWILHAAALLAVALQKWILSMLDYGTYQQWLCMISLLKQKLSYHPNPVKLNLQLYVLLPQVRL